MYLTIIALAIAVIVFIVMWAVAENGKAKMKLTAESAIMRNDDLNKQLKNERDLAEKRVKTLESLEADLSEAHIASDALRIRLSNIEKDRDQYKTLAEEGERTIQEQAKQIKELTEGDANGEVGRAKDGTFAPKPKKKAS